MQNTTGNPVDGEDFSGRKDELKQLRNAVEAGNHVLLVGPRRVGKSSLVAELSRELAVEGADVTLMPWFAAVQANVLGDKRHLVNIPLEARPAAEQIFDQIELRRQQLPAPRKSFA